VNETVLQIDSPHLTWLHASKYNGVV